MKNNKGITLIALIITIVVLLILAAITIVAVTDNDSAAKKAYQGKLETEKGEISDALEFALTNLKTIYYVENSGINGEKVYGDKAKFVTASNWDENAYPIESASDYVADLANKKVTIRIKKTNGTGKKHVFEINTETHKQRYIETIE